MNNKEKFMKLVSPEETNSLERSRERIRNREKIRERNKIKLENMEKKYLGYDGINNEFECFDNIDDARVWLEEGFLDQDEGYHPDYSCCKIYKLEETISLITTDKRSNYTHEEWIDKFGDQFDEICQHTFEKFDASSSTEDNDVK